MHAYERKTDVFLKTFENFCVFGKKSGMARQGKQSVAMLFYITEATGTYAKNPHASVNAQPPTGVK